MILKPQEIEVIEGSPFQNDKLDRKESAEVLTEFVLSSNKPMVVCIDAPWEEGKTTFYKNSIWREH